MLLTNDARFAYRKIHRLRHLDENYPYLKMCWGTALLFYMGAHSMDFQVQGLILHAHPPFSGCPLLRLNLWLLDQPILSTGVYSPGHSYLLHYGFELGNMNSFCSRLICLLSQKAKDQCKWAGEVRRKQVFMVLMASAAENLCVSSRKCLLDTSLRNCVWW